MADSAWAGIDCRDLRRQHAKKLVRPLLKGLHHLVGSGTQSGGGTQRQPTEAAYRGGTLRGGVENEEWRQAVSRRAVGMHSAEGRHLVAGWYPGEGQPTPS